MCPCRNCIVGGRTKWRSGLHLPEIRTVERRQCLMRLREQIKYVGNWPGVTVEKKEGKVRTKESKEEKIKVTDLPGVYSLSPYTLEEVVSRDYILNEDPDVIINLVDATNIERNLYLTTQLTETGVPVVIALNMADLIRKRGMKIDKKRLSELLNCPVIETSALKKTGLKELIEETVLHCQKRRKKHTESDNSQKS